MKKLIFDSGRYDIGLLVLRVCAGLYMALGHGWGKITGGPEFWERLGGTMEALFGIGFFPTMWGFLAAFSEFVCALLIVSGFLTKPAAIFLMGTMGVAATRHLMGGDGWAGQGSAELALLYFIIFLTILIVGPGKYSVDEKISRA